MGLMGGGVRSGSQPPFCGTSQKWFLLDLSFPIFAVDRSSSLGGS